MNQINRSNLPASWVDFIELQAEYVFVAMRIMSNEKDLPVARVFKDFIDAKYYLVNKCKVIDGFDCSVFDRCTENEEFYHDTGDLIIKLCKEEVL